VRISNLQDEANKYELMAQEKREELQQANEAIMNYQELNDDLCIKIEKLESLQKELSTNMKDSHADKLKENIDKIVYLEKIVKDQEMREKNSQKEIQELKMSNQEWANKTKQLFIEIQQNEIMQEKKDYEKSIKMNEMTQIIKDQKKKIQRLDDQVLLMKHKESVEFLKK